MRRTVLTAVLCSLLSVACNSTPSHEVDEGNAQMVHLGEPFQTSRGQVFVLGIQDEFRLIRCIPEGPIAGCYEDVYSVSRHAVDWNAWIDVQDVPGLRLAFLTPTTVAVLRDKTVAPPPGAK